MIAQAAKIPARFQAFVAGAPKFKKGQEHKAVHWLADNRLGDYSLHYLCDQLWLGRKFPKAQKAQFVRAARNYELYLSSPWLHNYPGFDHPLKALNWLINKQTDNNYTLGTLMGALDSAGHLPNKKKQQFITTAGAYTYFEKHEWMGKLTKFNKVKEAIKALAINRDDNNSLSYLMQCLWAGGKIPKKKIMGWQMMAGAAD